MSDLFLQPLFTWRSAVASPFGPANPTTRHVLLTLALHMNEKGESCFPSIDLLVDESGLSKRAVIEHLRRASDAGWIGKRLRRQPNGQGWKYMEYIPVLPQGIEASVKAWDEERRAARANEMFHGKQRGDRPSPTDKRGDRPASSEAGANSAKGGARHAEGGAPESPEYFSNTSTSTPDKRAARETLPPAPDWLPPEWQEFEKHRSEKRSKLTPTARQGCIRKLAAWREQGHDIVAILRHSIDNGYTGLFEPKADRASASKQSQLERRNADAAKRFVEKEPADASR